METRFWKLDREQIEPEKIKAAADLIRAGETVAFPTETVYGLGANALDDGAVRKIFAAKGRPSDNPLIVHVASIAQAEAVAEVTPLARKLMEAFWPGPLSIVLPKKDGVAPSVTAGQATVAVRMPNHPVALALIKAAGVPIAAPSANLSGKPSPTTADHVYHDLKGRVPCILGADDTKVGVESTVVQVAQQPCVLLRPGAITQEQLEAYCGEILLPNQQQIEIPQAPGMKYTHYAPEGKVYLVKNKQELQEAYAHWQRQEKKIVLLIPKQWQGILPAIPKEQVFLLGDEEDLAEIAAAIFKGLRYCDDIGAEIVLAASFDLEGIGTAIMNRLGKAAQKEGWNHGKTE